MVLLFARITEFDYPLYRVDFTTHDNAYDSDDEEHDWQFKFPIRFSYQDGLFLNKDEIPYNTSERYTARTFWANESTTIGKMIRDTFAVRRARGETIPAWSLAQICSVADDKWYRYIYHER